MSTERIPRNDSPFTAVYLLPYNHISLFASIINPPPLYPNMLLIALWNEIGRERENEVRAATLPCASGVTVLADYGIVRLLFGDLEKQGQHTVTSIYLIMYFLTLKISLVLTQLLYYS